MQEMQETQVEYPEGGNGNPLQYSCLEKPMDRGAWPVTVHGVTKSETWPTMHSHTHRYTHTSPPHTHAQSHLLLEVCLHHPTKYCSSSMSDHPVYWTDYQFFSSVLYRKGANIWLRHNQCSQGKHHFSEVSISHELFWNWCTWFNMRLTHKSRLRDTIQNCFKESSNPIILSLYANWLNWFMLVKALVGAHKCSAKKQGQSTS